MRIKPLFATMALGLCLFVSNADAGVLIDFSLVPDGALASYTESGVTFTSPGTTITGSFYGNTPNGTRGLISATIDFTPIKAVIAGGASSVSIDLGDHGADPDLLFLEIYDSSDALIGSTTLLIGDTDETMHTLSLSAPGIAYALYGSRDPSGSGSSVYTDNFSFEPGAAVPEPSTLAGAAFAGVLGLVVARRRRSA